MKKKVIVILNFFMMVVLCFFTSCTREQKPQIISIPNIIGVDEATAKNILSSNGLIPKTEYVYDDVVVEGSVVDTVPGIGEAVEKNVLVTIYVSKGVDYLECSDAIMSWLNVSYEEDNWEFYNPYIKEEVLFVECLNVSFSQAVTWSDRYQNGKIIGEACINDTFDKTVPISAKYEKQKWEANEPQSFVLEIPLADLNENRPTTMFLKLYAYDENGEILYIYVDFSMTW